MDQEPKQQQKRSPLVLVLIVIIVLLIAVAAVLAVSKLGGEQLEPAPVSSGGDGTPKIRYEEGVTVVDDPDALQKAVDDAYAQAAEGGVPLEYQNDATSKDGEKFDCYIANPAHANYDIFINIFSDEALTDELYLSGLIPPGKAIRELNLEKKLDPGVHRVYVAYTQVEDDHQTIHQQIFVTMDFTVVE